MLVLSLALWLWVTVDVRSRVDVSAASKRRWMVAAFLFPVFVSLLYLAIGRRRPAQSS
jgi:Phospholipase_D-nuclease N-terminal